MALTLGRAKTEAKTRTKATQPANNQKSSHPFDILGTLGIPTRGVRQPAAACESDHSTAA
jgi:hypothetical protein